MACGYFMMSFKDRICTWRISSSCCPKWKELRTKEDSFCPYKQLPVGPGGGGGGALGSIFTGYVPLAS